MPYYLVQLAYTNEILDPKSPEPHGSCEAGVRTARHHHPRFLIAFGECDAVVIIEAPGNVQAAAISMSITAGGAMSKVKTTPLMAWEEGVEAMQQAGEAGYQPPGAAGS